MLHLHLPSLGVQGSGSSPLCLNIGHSFLNSLVLIAPDKLQLCMLLKLTHKPQKDGRSQTHVHRKHCPDSLAAARGAHWAGGGFPAQGAGGALVGKNTQRAFGGWLLSGVTSYFIEVHEAVCVCFRHFYVNDVHL